MATPPADSQTAEITRFFTRAGRDPLTLAPFEMRRLENLDVRLPSPWSPEGMKTLANASAGSTSDQFLLDTAGQLAEAAELAGVAKTREEKQILHDEAAWVLAKGMMWMVEEADQTVAVINLAHFCEPVSQNFDLANLRYVVKLGTTLAAAKSITRSQAGRFSVAWTNLAGLLLSAAIPYDSSRAAGLAGNIAAIILGETVAQSARLAGMLPHLRHDATRTRAGLEYAKRKVDDLPLTRQVTLSANERDAWQQEAISSLSAGLDISLKYGVLNEIPVSPKVPVEANSWMGPIARGAEAIPSLEIPDAASRPEVKNVMRAIGLVDSLKGPFLGALVQGKDLEAAGVPKDKVGAMRTAKGTLLTFHPNSQIKMAEAVQPFVAGPLQHRIHLPEGVPAGFLQSLREYGQSVGLTGLEFGEEREGASLTLAENGLTVDPVARYVETPDEIPASEDTAPDESPVQMSATGEPEAPIEEASEVEGAIEEAASVEEVAPEVEAVTEETAPIEENASEVEAAPEESASIEEEAPAEAVGVDAPSEEESIEDAAPLAEAVAGESPTEEAVVEAVTPSEIPPAVPGVSWEAAAAGTVGAAVVGAALTSRSEETPAPVAEPLSDVASDLDETIAEPQEAVAELASAESVELVEAPLHPQEVSVDGAEPEAQSDLAPSNELEAVELASPLEVVAEEGQEPEAAESTLPAVPAVSVVPSKTPDLVDLEEPADAPALDPELPAQEEVEGALEPLATQTFRLNRDSGRHLVHAITDESGRLVEVALTSRDLGPNVRALVDSWCMAVSVGLQKGASIQDFKKEITQPGLVRDILDLLARAFPDTR